MVGPTRKQVSSPKYNIQSLEDFAVHLVAFIPPFNLAFLFHPQITNSQQDTKEKAPDQLLLNHPITLQQPAKDKKENKKKNSPCRNT